MPAYIALLRAINVGGHKKVAMADLRGLVAALGFQDVQTLLQTGNIVFRGGTKTGAALERLLETEAAERLGLVTDFFVRSGKEWQGIIARNPFRHEAKRDPSHLVVQLLKGAPRAGNVKRLQDAIAGPEVVRALGRQLYVFCPAGIGRSRLTSKLMEDKLGMRATGRNWNTVLKLGALAGT